ncbi:MAG: hypothetical protein PSN34_11805 [Urechidicola sp.]|nr:hypothetical protein [Urechidicola sp.]
MCIVILLFASNNTFVHGALPTIVNTLNFEISTNSQDKPLYYTNTVQASYIFEAYAIGYKNKTNISYSNDWSFCNPNEAFVKVSNKENNIKNLKYIYVRNKT